LSAAPSESQPLRAKVVEWLMQLDAAPHDAALRAKFEAWLAESDRHRAAFAVVEPVWRTSADLAPAPAPATIVSFGVRPARPARRRITFAAIGAIAAAAAFLFLPALQLHLQADYLTGVAEQRDLTLVDGSKIALDAGSAVAVRYGGQRREVDLLSGQAFFEVTHDRERPFVVKAGGVEVIVTGTAFSVDRSESGVTVAIREGSVDVALDGVPRPIASLVGGERLQVSREGKAAKGRIAAGEVASWRDRQFIVYDATVRDVVAQLGRYRNGVVMFADGVIADRLVSGVIDLGKPTEALQALVALQQGSIIEITPWLAIVSSR
jgi:transmembrane sensor